MWRFSDLSIEWQKEENGFLRPHNAHRGCLNRSTMHTKHLHFTWSLTQSLPLYHVALPCTQNCSLPLLFSAPVCGRCHMALLPSFLGSELVGWRPCGMLPPSIFCCHVAGQRILVFFYLPPQNIFWSRKHVSSPCFFKAFLTCLYVPICLSVALFLLLWRGLLWFRRTVKVTLASWWSWLWVAGKDN